MRYDPTKIPGLLDAQRQEQFIRDAAFFPVTESICGFEVCQMTLEQYLALKAARSPVLCGESFTQQDLALFLWVLSPEWSAGRRAGFRRWLFLMRVFIAFFRDECALVSAVERYVDETFMDRPPAPAALGPEPDYYSDGCAYCAFFGREYHQSFSATLKLPMKAIFQFVNEQKRHSGSTVPLRNPSEAIEAEYFASLNRN